MIGKEEDIQTEQGRKHSQAPAIDGQKNKLCEVTSSLQVEADFQEK